MSGPVSASIFDTPPDQVQEARLDAEAETDAAQGVPHAKVGE
jgi:hypothetical protein